jgi:hypothetical protein
MDPLTILLIGAGLFAATRIKKAATPRQAAPEAPLEVGKSFPGLFPPNVFASGLRPPVTSRDHMTSSTVEGQEQGQAEEASSQAEEASSPPAYGLYSEANPRALQAIASSGAADVVGTGAGGTTPTYQPPAYTGPIGAGAVLGAPYTGTTIWTVRRPIGP